MIYNLSNIKNCSFLTINEKEGVTYITYDNNYLTERFLYYFLGSGDTVFSYDFWELCDYLRKSGVKVTPNSRLYPFFDKKGYAPFDSTIVTEIYKLPNLFRAAFSPGKDVIYTLCNIEKTYTGTERELVTKAIMNCFKRENKNVILFSGGFDSTLIAYIAKKNDFDVELVNGAYSDDMSPNDPVEKEYSNRLASYLGQDYNVIKIDQHKVTKETITSIIAKQPNTAHFSLIFNAINEFYKGQPVNFISGQQADSILNYGSTSVPRINGLKPEGYGELIKRVINMSNSKVLKTVFKVLNPKLELAQPSIITGYRKFPIIKDSLTYNSIATLYSDFLSKCSSPECVLNNNILFYTLTHMSGSDASAIINCIDSIGDPLPFNDKELIWYYMFKKNSMKEKILPKRIIHEILQEDPTLYDIISHKPNTLNISYEIRFDVLCKELNLNQEYERLASIFDLPRKISYNNYHLAKCYERIFS